MTYIVYIIVLVGALVVAPLVHLAIAYGIAPSRAKEAILSALTQDSEFQTLITQSIVINFSKKMLFKDENGNNFESAPIDFFSEVFIQKFEQHLSNGKESFAKEMTSNAEMAMSMNPENPYLALALKQLPRKYWAYAQIIANLISKPPSDQ